MLEFLWRYIFVLNKSCNKDIFSVSNQIIIRQIAWIHNKKARYVLGDI